MKTTIPRLNPDWRKIAERASKESDPRKLIRLVRALCDRLEELHQQRSQADMELDAEQES